MMKQREITIPIGRDVELHGSLQVPSAARSLVIFSHGSGSSRFSIRNKFVADSLNNENIATLLTDLLTPGEDLIYQNRFDTGRLTKRLTEVTSYVHRLPELQHLSIGYFGASTGAASALNAAAQLPDLIHAVVSRGGRPDLALRALPYVTAPTLLIVGSLDEDVNRLNQQAYYLLQCEKKIQIIDGASHLFEEPGKLNEVAVVAAEWFKKYLHSRETQLDTINN